ncbi:hypothetical protein N0V95_001857 [Ascochyta clinopodiicola]|nr:hypothetical protein N0V95_001857 [Ascochyta clinopodiicola]
MTTQTPQPFLSQPLLYDLRMTPANHGMSGPPCQAFKNPNLIPVVSRRTQNTKITSPIMNLQQHGELDEGRLPQIWHPSIDNLMRRTAHDYDMVMNYERDAEGGQRWVPKDVATIRDVGKRLHSDIFALRYWQRVVSEQGDQDKKMMQQIKRDANFLKLLCERVQRAINRYEQKCEIELLRDGVYAQDEDGNFYKPVVPQQYVAEGGFLRDIARPSIEGTEDDRPKRPRKASEEAQRLPKTLPKRNTAHDSTSWQPPFDKIKTEDTYQSTPPHSDRLERGPLPSWRRSTKSIRIFPALAFMFAMAFSISLAIVRPSTQEAQCLEEMTAINPDIGGIGVFLGLFVPSVVLLIMLFLGHFKAEPSGAKEIGVAQLANTVYLLFNLAKAMDTINLRELLVACSSLDAVSASLSMTFSDKDVLAARNMIRYGFVCQIVAFGIESWAASRILPISKLEISLCSTNIQHVFHHDNRALAYAYLIVRFAALSLSALKQLGLARLANELEHVGDQTLLSHEARRWSTLPATILTNYLVFASFVLMHASFFLAITWVDAEDSSARLWSEWGQSAAFILAIYVTIHVGYSFCKVCSHEKVERRVEIARATGAACDWYEAGLTWRQYRWLLQRLPFCKHPLAYPDELLLENSTDLPISENEKNQRWKDLVESFSFSDKNGILLALAGGSPVDRQDEYKQHPIHMAARFGSVKILETIGSRLGTQLYDQLLHHNVSNETPLEIAFGNMNKEAAEWITVRLLRSPSHQAAEAQKIGATVLKKLITSESLDALQSFVSVWSSWYLVDVRPEKSPLSFAVNNSKFASLRLLRDRAMEVIPRSELPIYMKHIIPLGVECDPDLQRKGLIAWEKAGQDMNTVFQAATYIDANIVEELLLRNTQDISGHLLDSAYIYFQSLIERQALITGQTIDMRQSKRIASALVEKGALWYHNFWRFESFPVFQTAFEEIDKAGHLERVLQTRHADQANALLRFVRQKKLMEEKDYIWAVKWFLEHNVSMTETNESGTTALSMAMSHLSDTPCSAFWILLDSAMKTRAFGSLFSETSLEYFAFARAHHNRDIYKKKFLMIRHGMNLVAARKYLALLRHSSRPRRKDDPFFSPKALLEQHIKHLEHPSSAYDKEDWELELEAELRRHLDPSVTGIPLPPFLEL